MPLYDRPRATLVFIKDGRKTDTGQPILKQASYMFVEIGIGKGFVEPVSMRSVNDAGLTAQDAGGYDIVDIQIIDSDSAIPLNPLENSVTGPFGVQKFGDV